MQRFLRYTTVIYAPPAIRDEVNVIRAAAPPSGVPVMEGHVTTKGTFEQLLDEVEILRRMRACTARVEPFTLRAHGLVVVGQRPSFLVPVDPRPALAELHESLMVALADTGQYLDRNDLPGRYFPHLTLIQQCAPERAAEAEATLRAREYDWTFEATEVWLVGGDADLVWHPVAAVALGAKAPAP